ncbi:MAG: hypothetical protein WC749_02130 [Dehalococcoidia bacterium]
MHNHHLYLSVLPLKYLWLGGGSGSSGGGGMTTTTTNNTTKNEMLPWASYVPGSTSGAYERVMPRLEGMSKYGLTPQERAYYIGQGMNQLAGTQKGAQESLAGNLARSGARGGAVTEAYSDLARSKVAGGANIISNIEGMDIQQKGVNMDRLLKAIGLPNAPVITGTQTSGSNIANYAPQKQSGGGSS